MLWLLCATCTSIAVVEVEVSAIASSGLIRTQMQKAESHGFIVVMPEGDLKKYKGEIKIIGRIKDHYLCEIDTLPDQFAGKVDPNDELRLEANVYEESVTSGQYHLFNTGVSKEDINIENLYKEGIVGSNVTIAIIDDGLYWQHPALVDRFKMELSWNYAEARNDPSPVTLSSTVHGTQCGGVSSSGVGSECGIGVAPNSSIAGIVVLGSGLTVAKWVSALLFMNNKIDIKSNSYGPSGCKASGCPFTYLYSSVKDAITDSILRGRNGKGMIMTFAAGNNGLFGGDINYFDVAKLPFIISVGASSYTGGRTYYSNRGTSLLVNAPSGGKQNYQMTDPTLPLIHSIVPQGCSQTFTGTSASTPMVSGVIALMLEVNPNLGWRDVQMIIALSSTKNDPNHWSWIKNKANYIHSSVFGFGRINAEEAVKMAKTWVSLPSQVNFSTGELLVMADIPDSSNTPLSIVVTVRSGISFLESVGLTLIFTHASCCDLDIIIESPSGTKSKIKLPCIDEGTNTFSGYTMYSRQFLGETSGGNWIVHIYDRMPGHKGYVESVSLDVAGFNAGSRSFVQMNNQGGLFQNPTGSNLFKFVTDNLNIVKGTRMSILWNASTDLNDCPLDFYLSNGKNRWFIGNADTLDAEGVIFSRFPSTIKSGLYNLIAFSQKCGIGDTLSLNVQDGNIQGCSVSYLDNIYDIEWNSNLPELPYDGWEGNFIVTIASEEKLMGRCGCPPFGKCKCSISTYGTPKSLKCWVEYVGIHSYMKNVTNPGNHDFEAEATTNAPFLEPTNNANNSKGTNWALIGSLIGVSVAVLIGSIVAIVIICKRKGKKNSD